MAFPSGPHPFPIAMACVLGALLAFERRPALAGVLVGACAAWRIEFAALRRGGDPASARPDGLRRFALAGGSRRPPSSTSPS